MAMKPDEERAFEAIAQNFEQDPQFSKKIHNMNRKFSSGGRLTKAVAVLVVGFVVLFIGLDALVGIAGTITGVVGFIILWGGGLLLDSSREDVQLHGGSSSNQSEKPKSEFMKNLENKWEERRKEQGLN